MFKNFTVKARLIFLLAAAAMAILGIGFVTITHIQHSKNEINHLYFGGLSDVFLIFKALEASENIEDAIYQVQIGTLNWTAGIKTIQDNQERVRSNWGGYMNQPSYLSEELDLTAQNLKGRIQQLIANADNLLSRIQLSMQNQDKEQMSLLIQEIPSIFNPLRQFLSQLIELHTKDTESDYEIAVNRLSTLGIVATSILVGCFIVALVLSLLIIRSIVSPLLYAVDCMNKAAEGNTEIQVENSSGGELGSLLKALDHMILSSKKMGTACANIASGDLSVEVMPRSEQDTLGIAMNEMLDQMRYMIGEIQSEVNTLNSSSQEITSSLSQLSTGAAETAAAVTETTTTIEELKQTAHLSADKAKEVLSSVEETFTTVKSSEKSVSDTINEMNQIQERMKSISDSIVKLSERSLAIAEIMDSVNDLAEQSNLLAVNAAIEAAKAGEQGRGFNVVAQEIRALAEQSKAATAQVKALLLEIQNATNVAVLATEQGSKAVLKGVDQSAQTNAAINELMSNISLVSQAANQIVLSSQQQFVGIEQVTVAMANINDATNQHVRELNQIEKSTSLLKQVVLSLKKMTDQYKLSTQKANKVSVLSKRLEKALNSTDQEAAYSNKKWSKSII